MIVFCLNQSATSLASHILCSWASHILCSWGYDCIYAAHWNSFFSFSKYTYHTKGMFPEGRGPKPRCIPKVNLSVWMVLLCIPWSSVLPFCLTGFMVTCFICNREDIESFTYLTVQITSKRLRKRNYLTSPKIMVFHNRTNSSMLPILLNLFLV